VVVVVVVDVLLVGLLVAVLSVLVVGVSVLAGFVPPLQPAVTRRRAAQTASAARLVEDLTARTDSAEL